MNTKTCSVITGSGSYIPTEVVKNEHFYSQQFYNKDETPVSKTSKEVADKLEEITGIKERRYVTDDLLTSDIATIAAQNAIADAKIDKESLDYIIVAHNFGDVKKGQATLDMVPSLAARVKKKLGIQNPKTIAFDLPFGCPGWLQALIHVHIFMKAGEAQKALVIGAETLSRVYDVYDMDSMIYSDGAGAVVVEQQKCDEKKGIIAYNVRSDTANGAADLLYMDASYNPALKKENQLFLKMHGHKIYEYALNTVPQAIKECLDKSGISITDCKYLLIHQANEKMDQAIAKRLFRLYGISKVPSHFMPMSIQWLGNNSVATLPILYDLIQHGKMEGYRFESGDYIIMASVGAGMNINAAVYRC